MGVELPTAAVAADANLSTSTSNVESEKKLTEPTKKVDSTKCPDPPATGGTEHVGETTDEKVPVSNKPAGKEPAKSARQEPADKDDDDEADDDSKPDVAGSPAEDERDGDVEFEASDDDDDEDDDDEEDDDEDDDDDAEDDDEAGDNSEGDGEVAAPEHVGIEPGVIAQLLSKDRLGTKALHAAALANDAGAINTILSPDADPKVDVNVTDAFDYCAIHVAAENGATEAVSALVAAGASLEAVSKMHDCRPLHYAAFEGHAAVVRVLVEAGADVNALTDDGRTPLYQAAFRGHEDCVKTLLEFKADRTIACQDGKKPVDVAEEVSIVHLLSEPAEKKARVEQAE